MGRERPAHRPWLGLDGTRAGLSAAQGAYSGSAALQLPAGAQPHVHGQRALLQITHTGLLVDADAKAVATAAKDFRRLGLMPPPDGDAVAHRGKCQ